MGTEDEFIKNAAMEKFARGKALNEAESEALARIGIIAGPTTRENIVKTMEQPSIEHGRNLLRPDSELVPGVPASILEPYGQFIDAQDSSADSGSILFLPHSHSSSSLMSKIMPAGYFDAFVRHQDMIYHSLTSLAEKLSGEKRLHLIMEGRKPGARDSQEVFESIMELQDRRDRREPGVMDELRSSLLEEEELREWTRLRLHGGARFFAREMLEGRTDTVLPGSPVDEIKIHEPLLKELQQCASNAYNAGGILDDEEAKRIVQRHHNRYRLNHIQRHTFVAQQLKSVLQPGHLGVVLYGRGHFHGQGTYTPIEDWFPAHRYFVFQAHGLSDIQTYAMDSPEADTLYIAPSLISFEDVRLAIRELLENSDRPLRG